MSKKEEVKSEQLKQIEESFKKASEAMALFGASFKEFMHANKKENKEQPPEFEYPMFFEFISTGEIVKFSAIEAGETVKKGSGVLSEDVGYVSASLLPHTKKRQWKRIPHDKETGFYDKQPILCKDEGDVSWRIRAWDNVNKCAFDCDGLRKSVFNWDHYCALEVVQKEMQPYFENLED